eukprot:4520967-Amphidinium_carterae.1
MSLHLRSLLHAQRFKQAAASVSPPGMPYSSWALAISLHDAGARDRLLLPTLDGELHDPVWASRAASTHPDVP